MADLPHRRHGNSPPRRAQHELHLATSPETRSDSGSTTEAAAAAAAEEHVCGTRICEKKKESNQFCNEETKPTSPRPEKRQRPPDKSVTALLKRIRIHPEAQRILGNSCIPVVSLERLNFRSVSLSCLQPVVCLVRLPSQKQTELHDDDASHHQQNGFSQTEEDVFEITDDSPESEGLSDPSPPDETTSTSWTEPYCPDSSSSEEPEQDSGFDCESNPDQPYILFDSGCDEWEADEKTETDPEMFYLDPDPEQQNMVIQVDPEPEVDQDQDLPLQVVDEPEIKCEVDVVQMVQMDDGDEQGLDLRCSVKEEDSSNQHEPVKEETVETESEDFCGVCLNGGDLLCCDRCPKVYHLTCHIPPLISFPLGDWVCSLCRSDQEPVEVYDCENTNYVKAPYTLSNQDQRRCEKLTLLLCCHLLSAPFHEPVSPLARNYYQIIKRPVDLSLIRRKLDKSNTLHYFSAEQFVDDVLLMFKNCATFNYPDSEVAQAGRNLEVFFLSKLTELFPDRTFPSASQDRTDRARLLWMNRTKKENHRKKRRHVFSGKKYYL